jgi:hypothetical protein
VVAVHTGTLWILLHRSKLFRFAVLCSVVLRASMHIFCLVKCGKSVLELV